jgi:hypothetical protein
LRRVASEDDGGAKHGDGARERFGVAVPALAMATPTVQRNVVAAATAGAHGRRSRARRVSCWMGIFMP